jgi:hypothetical protein
MVLMDSCGMGRSPDRSTSISVAQDSKPVVRQTRLTGSIIMEDECHTRWHLTKKQFTRSVCELRRLRRHDIRHIGGRLATSETCQERHGTGCCRRLFGSADGPPHWLHSHSMRHEGTATFTYMPQSLKAAQFQPGQVHLQHIHKQNQCSQDILRRATSVCACYANFTGPVAPKFLKLIWFDRCIHRGFDIVASLSV